VVLYGCDVHPDFQRGLNIEQVRAEGFDFIAVKVSEGAGTYGGQDWLRRAKRCGLIPMGYHYLRPGNEDEQARVFAGQLLQADVPGMLDAEALAGDTPTLTVAGIHRFIDAVRLQGARVPLLYLPRWFHQRMGSPDLSGLPQLWASGYVSGGGYAADLYQAVTPKLWAPYGGLPVAVLQFTDQALLAGQKIDADAFLGTRDELATLLTATMPTPTPPPSGPDSIPAMAYGQTSDSVRHLQDWLNHMFESYSHLPVTGFYGDLTQAVIREFQRRVNIVGGDGANVGPLTRAKLYEHGFRYP
jgi:lysozyme